MQPKVGPLQPQAKHEDIYYFIAPGFFKISSRAFKKILLLMKNSLKLHKEQLLSVFVCLPVSLPAYLSVCLLVWESHSFSRPQSHSPADLPHPLSSLPPFSLSPCCVCCHFNQQLPGGLALLPLCSPAPLTLLYLLYLPPPAPRPQTSQYV